MKQYLMMVNDDLLPALERLLPGVKCLEVQGLKMGGGNEYNVLVTPVIQPVPQMNLAQPNMPPDQPVNNVPVPPPNEEQPVFNE
jgi:hypothetical protein